MPSEIGRWLVVNEGPKGALHLLAKLGLDGAGVLPKRRHRPERSLLRIEPRLPTTKPPTHQPSCHSGHGRVHESVGLTAGATVETGPTCADTSSNRSEARPGTSVC